jgi:glycosyltransferase involved in cell wall biosynthesis
MKVLLVHNSYQQPGGEDVVCEQEHRLLVRAGHQVVTYNRSNWEIEDSTAWERIGLAWRTIWNEAARQEILGLLERERPDLVHVHNTFMMISPSIFSACQEARVPVVQSMHNYRLFCPAATFFRNGGVCEECVEHSLWRGVRYGCYRGSRAATGVVALMLAVNRRRRTWTDNVDGFIALTGFARLKLIEGGLPDEKITVKPNFVYPDPGEGLGPRDYALFVGRLSPEKGVRTLLAAWTKLRPSVPLLILGSGPDRPVLEDQVLRQKLSRVEFRGHVSRPDTLAAIQGARFLVFSSEWYENFPVTIAEAFACGTPVICSRRGAIQEIVDDGRTGLHFTPGDAGELASRVEWACDHPNEMRSMGREARREFEVKYTAEGNYPMLMDAYRRAIARRHGSRAVAAG